MALCSNPAAKDTTEMPSQGAVMTIRFLKRCFANTFLIELHESLVLHCIILANYISLFHLCLKGKRLLFVYMIFLAVGRILRDTVFKIPA